MPIYRLKPSYKDYLWGGNRLREKYNKNSPDMIIAETWELSTHPDGNSLIVEEDGTEIELSEFIEEQGREILGNNARRFDDFPLMVKLIDAKKPLSVQVHPDEAYAREHENQHGKTEMWIVLDCDEDSTLFYGPKRELSKEEFLQAIKDNTLTDLLKEVPVKRGDVFFIPSGTIHAIGKGCLIAEIQQNSNVTYRIYDYNRRGSDGKKRELHLNEAAEVVNLSPVKEDFDFKGHTGLSSSFLTDIIKVKDKPKFKLIDNTSFAFLMVTEGKGSISTNGQTIELFPGDSVFITAGTGPIVLEGDMECIEVKIPSEKLLEEKPDGQLKIGIDLGGTDIKAGVLTPENTVLSQTSVPTEVVGGINQVVLNMLEAVRLLLEETDTTLDDYSFCGIGSPGTIETETGDVVYSNNFNWEDVPLGRFISEALGLPVEVRNDASVAALGEAVAGSGEPVENLVLITLGTGVGGGIIIDGKIYEGFGSGGSEIGHTLLIKDGRRCSCGRNGCLEAYVSATALIDRAKETLNKNSKTTLLDFCGGDKSKITAKTVFEAADAGDKAAGELLENYYNELAEGIANIINVFRPQEVLLGGGISNRGQKLISELEKRVPDLLFGGKNSYQSKIKCASLGNNAGIIGAANIR